jgi:hypothetical protein
VCRTVCIECSVLSVEGLCSVWSVLRVVRCLLSGGCCLYRGCVVCKRAECR